MNGFTSARDGIELMYNSIRAMLVCLFFGLVPFVSYVAIIALIVYVVRYFMGLYEAGKDISGCRKAFIVSILAIVLGIVGSVIKAAHVGGDLYLILSMLSDLFGVVGSFLIIISIARVLDKNEEAGVARYGYATIGLNIGYYVLSVILVALTFKATSLMNQLKLSREPAKYFEVLDKCKEIAGTMQIVSGLVVVVGIVVVIVQMVFLKKSIQSFWNIYLKNL